MKYKLVILSFLLLSILKIKAQSFNLDFLFGPGLTLGTDYVPHSSVNDSTDFQFTKYKAQY
ncbi:hypothetical protein, partial [Pseudomonas sp. RTB2]|uniref:hypothetical protein n=1 Tax=Pseudomonas sp. RTB2 TaxID=3048632 RepID=UPI002B22657A